MACCNREHETLREREKGERVWGRGMGMKWYLHSWPCTQDSPCFLSSDLRCIPPFVFFLSYMR